MQGSLDGQLALSEEGAVSNRDVEDDHAVQHLLRHADSDVEASVIVEASCLTVLCQQCPAGSVLITHGSRAGHVANADTNLPVVAVVNLPWQAAHPRAGPRCQLHHADSTV